MELEEVKRSSVKYLRSGSGTSSRRKVHRRSAQQRINRLNGFVVGQWLAGLRIDVTVQGVGSQHIAIGRARTFLPPLWTRMGSTYYHCRNMMIMFAGEWGVRAVLSPCHQA